MKSQSPQGATGNRADTPPAEVGPLIDEYVRLDRTTPVFVESGRWRGKVLNIDRFGNIVTSFPAELLDESPSDFRILVGQLEVHETAPTYAKAPPGMAFAIAGSGGFLELSMNQESAAADAAVNVGNPVELVFSHSNG